MIDKQSDSWSALPLWLKWWFGFNFMQLRPERRMARRIASLCHVSGFIFCLLGLVSEAALLGGLLMLANGYLFSLLNWQGDRYGIWYDRPDGSPA